MTDHTDVVRSVKSDLLLRGFNLEGPCGAFQITKRVAWALRSEGVGLLDKPGGNNCEGYATDIVMYPDGALVDILGDGGGANTSQWSVTGEIRPMSQYRPAFDPGDGPISTPPPIPPPPPLPPTSEAAILAAIAALRAEFEAFAARVEALARNVKAPDYAGTMVAVGKKMTFKPVKPV